MAEADALVAWLHDRYDCAVAPGLTDAELDAAEAAYGVTFPPLWRAVLRRVLPVDKEPHPGRPPGWPDWRAGDPAGLRHLVEGPVDGLLFDVEHGDFWWHAWGRRPPGHDDRLRVAGARLAEVPRLLPVHGNWYVAATDDSPVFSIVQADLYVPAPTIADLATGRTQDAVDVADWPIGNVPFWSELHAYAQLGHYDERFGPLGQGGL